MKVCYIKQVIIQSILPSYISPQIAAYEPVQTVDLSADETNSIIYIEEEENEETNSQQPLSVFPHQSMFGLKLPFGKASVCVGDTSNADQTSNMA